MPLTCAVSARLVAVAAACGALAAPATAPAHTTQTSSSAAAMARSAASGSWGELYSFKTTGLASATSNSTSASRKADYIEFWWVAPDGSVWGAHASNKNAMSRYRLAPPGQRGAGGGIEAVSRRSNAMEVWWIAPNGSVQAAWWLEGQGWRRYQLAPAGSASVVSEVAVASRNGDAMEVRWVRAERRGRGRLVLLGPGLEPLPASSARQRRTERRRRGRVAQVQRDGGLVDRAHRLCRGRLDDSGNRRNRYQLAPPGSASITGDVAAVSRKSDAMEVWWIGPSGSIEAAWTFVGTRWNRYQLAPPGSALTSGEITAVLRKADAMEVWWIGPSGSIEAAWTFVGTRWNRYQLAAAGRASLIAGITSTRCSRTETARAPWSSGGSRARSRGGPRPGSETPVLCSGGRRIHPPERTSSPTRT